jgi:hypothetical protein
MWEVTDELGIKSKCEYFPDNLKYIVSVEKDKKSLKKEYIASYNPLFGMEISEHSGSLRLAEQLANQLTKL